MQTLLVLLLTIPMAVNVFAAPTDSYSPSSDGRLHIIRVADNSLEAIFYNADAGIRIRASSLSLSLYSMDGEELLLSGDKPHGSSLFATVMGHSFLEYNTTLEDGRIKIVDYAVPDSLAEQAKEAVESAKVERMLSQLEDNDTEVTTESAFQELFQRPEIALIESAAIALGRAGVMGYENQGALNFYMVARALTRARGREEVEEGDMRQDQATGSYRQKRTAAAWPPSIPPSPVICNAVAVCMQYCPNNGCSCCTCPEGDYCLGMCGPPGCNTCWWFVCGDCCYHRGCYDHDICCIRGQWLRCWFPFGFTCQGYPGYW